jgi:hypothetical protein
MICNCSQCEKKLRIPDSMMGRMAMCPNCKNKFRVAGPGGDETDEIAKNRSAAEPRPKGPLASPRTTPRPTKDAPPDKRSREWAEEKVDELEEIDELEELDDDDKAPRRPGRKRNAKIGARPHHRWSKPSPLAIFLGGVIAVGFVVVGIGFFVPQVLMLIIAASAIAYIVGHIMVVIAAFQESAAHGILCIVFGPYTWIFAIMHSDEVRAAWLLWGASLTLFLLMVCGAVVETLLFGNHPSPLHFKHGQATWPVVQRVVVI